jgi:hypothetical protein
MRYMHVCPRLEWLCGALARLVQGSGHSLSGPALGNGHLLLLSTSAWLCARLLLDFTIVHRFASSDNRLRHRLAMLGSEQQKDSLPTGSIWHL